MADTHHDGPGVLGEAEKETQPEHAQDESKHALFGPPGPEFYGANKEIALYADGSHAPPFVTVRTPVLKNDVCWILRNVFGLVGDSGTVDVDIHCFRRPDQRIVPESSGQGRFVYFVAGLLKRCGIEIRIAVEPRAYP